MAIKKLIGSDKNQISLNRDFGKLAWQDDDAATLINPAISGNVTTTGLNFDSNTLVIDATNNRIGIGTASPAANISYNTNQRLLGIAGSAGASASSFGSLNLQNNRATPTTADFIGSIDFVSTNDTLPLKAQIYGQLTGSGGGVGGFGANLIFATRADNNASTSERVRITSTGVVELAQGQIKFPATQSASTDANTLDDYEEGTWTPTALGGTTAGTTTYTTQSGRYTKVGNKVTLHFTIEYSATTGTGSLLIGGLPFACGFLTTGSIITNFYNWTGGTYLSLYLPASSSSINIYGGNDDGSWTVQTITNESAAFTGSITYQV